MTNSSKRRLDGEDAFELFTWIMNDPQWPARILPLSCAMYELLSGSLRELRGTSCASRNGIDCGYSD
jgi:hypothetical protein